MIAVTCARCGKELQAGGALVFSPPELQSVCVKSHVCRECWPMLVEWLLQQETQEQELFELRHMREASRRILARWGIVEAWIEEAKAHLRLQLQEGEADVEGIRLARRIDEILMGMGGQP